VVKIRLPRFGQTYCIVGGIQCKNLLRYTDKIESVDLTKYWYDYHVISKAYLSSVIVTDIFTHNMAAKTSWHRDVS